MDYQDLMKEIEKGDLAPVYFFFGTEVFLIEQLVRKIVEKGIDPATKDFNRDILEGEQVDGATVVGRASAYPMMSDRRVVVVKSIQRLSTSDKNKILEYVRSPLESTCLILTAGDVDRRQSFYKSLTKSSRWVECAELYENQAVDWVKRTLREKGINLAHEGAVLMVQQVGTSLWNLNNEIEKLLTYSWGEKNLDLKHINAIVGFSRQFNMWEFTDAVGQKNFMKAISLAVKLLEAGQSPAGLIVSLSRRLFLLMHMRSMLDRGMSPPQITQALKFRPYFARLYMNQVERYDAEELKSAVRVLLQADCALKTGYIEPLMALTLVIHHLVRGSGRKMLP